MKVNIGPYAEDSDTEDFQRQIDVEIHDYDVWSLDHTLAHIILPALILLKEKKHGSPVVDDEDVPEEIRSTSAAPKENEWDIDEHWHARWDYVMDEMIWAFRAMIEDEEPFDAPELVKHKAWHERIDRGVKFFGKYYRGLWD